jgi:hypothetical protein
MNTPGALKPARIDHNLQLAYAVCGANQIETKTLMLKSIAIA